VAKSKSEYWLTDTGLTLITGWARDGLTEAQIAQNMGVSMSTLSNYKLKYEEILEALKAGKEVADYAVESALYRKACGGDTVAMIFWLKNRRPTKWRDKPLSVGTEDILAKMALMFGVVEERAAEIATAGDAEDGTEQKTS
jgi:transcriptional regulator with XRE-family HTH domain